MREDIDLAYRCYHCNGLVFKSDILYPPHGCTKCGGSKVRPINGLTWFGVLYCKFWNWYKFKTKGKKDEQEKNDTKIYSSVGR